MYWFENMFHLIILHYYLNITMELLYNKIIANKYDIEKIMITKKINIHELVKEYI